MTKLFIAIDLIFKKTYLQVKDSPSWLPHTKIMQHSGRSSLVSLMWLIEFRGYLNHTCVFQHSGTEVCLRLSNEADVDEFILWLVGFVRKVCVHNHFYFTFFSIFFFRLNLSQQYWWSLRFVILSVLESWVPDNDLIMETYRRKIFANMIELLTLCD